MFTWELPNHFRARAIPLNISLSPSFLIYYIFFYNFIVLGHLGLKWNQQYVGVEVID